MSNTKTEIDYEKIWLSVIPYFGEISQAKGRGLMKEAIKAALPIILAEAAEKAEITINWSDDEYEAKADSITNLANSTELKTKLGIT